MIQLSKRYQYADIFWFSFFHELGHILLHSRKEAFVELGNKTEFEEEADEFSTNCLIPWASYNKFIEKGQFSSNSIVRFAEKVSIDPGIVVGRLQHEKRLEYNCFQDIKKKLN
ncbi:MAG: ImmA/IrrE family metallo-endopeptidase [Syntrophomonadaceae bacterium]|nr:ImmA/IrrE family metallo-endopeptidase [Syntrophomonadaceae bacterium]MDD3022549.1 ImmA/IrrE family metallo-endopeptidase [Syntrophomonadaceae bacterium]